MKLKVGDFVEVLDEDLSGKVFSVENNNVTIQTEDGFELEFDAWRMARFLCVGIFGSGRCFLSVICVEKNKKIKNVLKTL